MAAPGTMGCRCVFARAGERAWRRPQRRTACSWVASIPARGRVARPELRRRLSLPGGVQRLVVLARLQADDPRLELGPGAAGAQRARRAVLPGEAGLEDHAV